jgi:hypothetical protein
MRLETAWACEASFAKTVTLFCGAMKCEHYTIRANEFGPGFVNISNMLPLFFGKGVEIFVEKATLAEIESAAFWQLRVH